MSEDTDRSRRGSGSPSRDEVRSTSDAIRRYVKDRPRAWETPEGVARWWLARQRMEDSPDVVEAALEELVGKGQLERKQLPDGRVVYGKTSHPNSP